MFSRTTWTSGVVIFFDCTASMLASTTVWEVVRPTAERKGFLPTATTHGDRLFIGLLTVACINLAWVGLTSEETSAWSGFTASTVVLIIVMWRD